MLMSAQNLRKRRVMVIRRRLIGVLFLAVLAGLPVLAVAVYDKAFSHPMEVTLHTDFTGNQLRPTADVKERGVIVGSVRKVHSVGDGAIVTLAIDPKYADDIPANTVAQILPKTLLGQEYVSLAVPSSPSGPIQAGDQIEQDHSAASLETQEVLGNLLPVLQAINPAQFNVTLTAMADSLRGHGEDLGHLLVSLDKYVKTFNEKTPQGDTYTQRFVTNLQKLGQVALKYNQAAPAIADALDNLRTTSNTISAGQPQMQKLFSSIVGASDTTGDFLGTNESNIDTVSSDSAQVFGLLGEYAPEYDCTFTAMGHVADLAAGYFHGGEAHLSMQIDNGNMGKYKPGQGPRLISGYGPGCYGLPSNPTPQRNGHFIAPDKFVCMNDGAPLTQRCARGLPAAGGK
jgi:virulence factor Mce-like protein